MSPKRKMPNHDGYMAAIRRRCVLTDEGRKAIGLPPVDEPRWVPLLDLPWRDDARDRKTS